MRKLCPGDVLINPANSVGTELGTHSQSSTTENSEQIRRMHQYHFSNSVLDTISLQNPSAQNQAASASTATRTNQISPPSSVTAITASITTTSNVSPITSTGVTSATSIHSRSLDMTSVTNSTDSSASPEENMPEVPVVQKGVKIGSGVVVDMVGEGGMTKVYRIWNDELETHRVVKLVNDAFTKKGADRFRTEAKICAKFDHPNIIRIHTIGDWHNIPFIEMEYIEGETLDYYCKKYNKIPSPVAAAILTVLSKALYHVHSAAFTLYGTDYFGIIHRDLKPSNIMICRDGTVKLMDFGIARPVQTGLHTQEQKNVIGTLQYFSPEQLENNRVDHRTDIYAVGAILYEMIAGVKAFPSQSITELIKLKAKNEFPSLDSYEFPINNSLKNIVNTCLATEREERFATSDDLAKALAKAYHSITNYPADQLLKMYAKDPEYVEQLIQKSKTV